MDENLARWLFLSIAKHFDPVVTGIGIPYYIEGVMERSDDTMREDHIELRVTGPDIKETNGKHEVRISINFLCTALMDMAGADTWRIVQWTGVLQNEMLQPIPIYRYGTGGDDDQSLIGCLRVDNNRVNVYHFGQLDKDTRVRQSEVDASFSMDV